MFLKTLELLTSQPILMLQKLRKLLRLKGKVAHLTHQIMDKEETTTEAVELGQEVVVDQVVLLSVEHPAAVWIVG